MSASFLRELTLYSFSPPHTLKKTRKVIHCSAKPRREADPSERFLPRAHVFLPHGRFLLLWATVMLLAVLYQTLTVPFFLLLDAEDNQITSTSTCSAHLCSRATS